MEYYDYLWLVIDVVSNIYQFKNVVILLLAKNHKRFNKLCISSLITRIEQYEFFTEKSQIEIPRTTYYLPITK